MIPLNQHKSLADVIIDIVRTDKQVLELRGHASPDEYDRVKCYLGMKYDCDIAILRERGYKMIADSYEARKERW